MKTVAICDIDGTILKKPLHLFKDEDLAKNIDTTFYLKSRPNEETLTKIISESEKLLNKQIINQLSKPEAFDNIIYVTSRTEHMFCQTLELLLCLGCFSKLYDTLICCNTLSNKIQTIITIIRSLLDSQKETRIIVYDDDFTVINLLKILFQDSIELVFIETDLRRV